MGLLCAHIKMATLVSFSEECFIYSAALSAAVDTMKSAYCAKQFLSKEIVGQFASLKMLMFRIYSSVYLRKLNNIAAMKVPF